MWMRYFHCSKTCGVSFSTVIFPAISWSRPRGFGKTWSLLISRTSFLHSSMLRTKKDGFTTPSGLKSVSYWRKYLGNHVLWQPDYQQLQTQENVHDLSLYYEDPVKTDRWFVLITIYMCLSPNPSVVDLSQVKEQGNRKFYQCVSQCSKILHKPREQHEAISGKAGCKEKVLHQGGDWQWNMLPSILAMSSGLLELRKHLDSALRHKVWILSGPVDPGVGLGDPWWSLPTCFILWFCDNYRTFLGLYIYICCWNKQYLQDSRKLVLEQFILIVVYAYTVWICGCKFSHSLRKSEHVGLTQGRIFWLVPQYSIHLCKIHFSFVAGGLFVTTHKRKKNGRLNWSSIIGIFHEPSLK